MSEDDKTSTLIHVGHEGSIQLDRKKYILKEAFSITTIVFFVLIFRSVFFEPFRIPSGSMIPTLMIGDFILVNKASYGFKVPFSHFFGDPIYISSKTDPKRGDVIVFKYPHNKKVDYIKRVVGLPGEKIEIKNKIVYVNGEPIEALEFPGKKIMADMDDKFKDKNLKFYQTQTGEHDHVIQLAVDNIYSSEYSPRVVPENHFFVMGDNRDFSSDSRFWGFVPFNNIKGRAIMVWFSWILPFGDHEIKFRPWRIGKSIE